MNVDILDPDFIQEDFFMDLDDVAGEIQVSQSSVCNREQIPLESYPIEEESNTNIAHDHDYALEVNKLVGAMERLVLLEKENIELKKKIRRHQKNISKDKSMIRTLKAEMKDLKKLLADLTPRLIDPVLLELQQNKSRKLRGARFSDKMKNMAIVLHYCSNKAYRQMRKYFTLPAITTIKSWLKRLEIKEGYTTSILQLLKLRAAGLQEDEKLVTVFVDEMSVEKRLTYISNAKEDYFNGFETKLYHEDTNLQQLASNALTVMIKSIKSGFKQAIGYFFNVSSTTASRLHTIVQKGLSLITKTGFIPKMLVCDQNSTNRSLFKTLNVSEQQPWFIFKKKKVYCRNNLLRHNAFFDSQMCSYQHIVDLYYEDIKHIPRTVPKLTHDHVILAPFAEMNVGKATQTLSESVCWDKSLCSNRKTAV